MRRKLQFPTTEVYSIDLPGVTKSTMPRRREVAAISTARQSSRPEVAPQPPLQGVTSLQGCRLHSAALCACLSTGLSCWCLSGSVSGVRADFRLARWPGQLQHVGRPDSRHGLSNLKIKVASNKIQFESIKRMINRIVQYRADV